ncbi:uncharacterized protein BDZ99DRAFT_116914 [Mytilinidion resinicola]|uniref:Uncharacterized protein n=1 Tax=Mytilinidion resinicola TaxID=574789 RepID=A0A6A6Y9H0_9PEZI|nr:uncharacterized protein BDZ99DRAFT_116914 [Mytilinidion resinicola]KAF2805279.1 hypothetical protein BDZ99DRAFT_116914 [Mytilinidion resinicola]
MHFSTPFLALLALTTTALADRPARQYRRDPSPERSNALLPRINVDPTLLCGDNYVDCNNGWCCSEGDTCTTLQSVPVCKDPSQSLLGGTVPAFPFKSIDQIKSSIDGLVSSISAGLVTASGAAPTGTAKTTGTATGTAAAATATGTGAAARLGAWGAAGVLGAGVMMVI